MYKHYFRKFVMRAIVFIVALVIYVMDKNMLDFTKFNISNNFMWTVCILWVIFIIEMIIHSNPKAKTSIGCGKQYRNNYISTNEEYDVEEREAYFKQKNIGAVWVLVIWILVNSVFGIMYYADIIGIPELVMQALLYYLSDLICVLFFCPFQVFIMRNRCCAVCRIFAWDSIMMVTPLIFVRNLYSISLVVYALVLLIVWEYRYAKYPERFYEKANSNLKCANCNDKLCKIRDRVDEDKALIDIFTQN